METIVFFLVEPAKVFVSFGCMQKSESKVATLNCLRFDGINAASNEIYIYIHFGSDFTNDTRCIRETESMCLYVWSTKYFDCCSVLCALRIRCMLYVVLFFFFNWNYSRARLDVFVARKNNRIKSVYVNAQERFEFKVVASWSHGGRRIHIHTLMLILYWRLSLYMYPMEFWSSFCIEKIKHVFMCVVVDVLHVFSIECMRWKYFRPKIQCFHCNFGKIVQYQKKDDFKQMANVIFFLYTIFVSMSNETNTKCMYWRKKTSKLMNLC